MAAVLATVSVIIGLGPLLSRRAGIYIGLGIALALLYWVTGQGLGELLTFGGTDPNNGPIIASHRPCPCCPSCRSGRAEPTIGSRFLAANPLGALAPLLAIVLIPTAVAIVPSIGRGRRAEDRFELVDVRHVDVRSRRCRAVHVRGRP